VPGRHRNRTSLRLLLRRVSAAEVRDPPTPYPTRRQLGGQRRRTYIEQLDDRQVDCTGMVVRRDVAPEVGPRVRVGVRMSQTRDLLGVHASVHEHLSDVAGGLDLAADTLEEQQVAFPPRRARQAPEGQPYLEALAPGQDLLQVHPLEKNDVGGSIFA